MTTVALQRRSLVMKKPVDTERGNWDKHVEFLLSLMGYCVGFGNVWRFPFRCYENGGAAFLFPYLILMLLIGKPLFVIESVIGQFLSLGPVQSFGMRPVLKGVGVGAVLLSFYFTVYYIMYMVYTTKMLYFSWQDALPWSGCFEWWGPDESCFVRGREKPFPKCVVNETENELRAGGNATQMQNCTQYGPETSSNQFWNKYVLYRTRESRLEVLGKFKPDLCGLLFVNWLLVFACLVRGIKSSGKIVYFTALFPYVVLISMAIFGCTLRGAAEGLYFLFVPDFEKLLTIKVWKAALGQLFFSLGLGIGGIIMCASYNKFENKVHWDAVLITSIDLVTSVLASLAVFTTLGFLAHELDADIADVVEAGPGLMFVVIPEAISMLPVPNLFSFMFFLMVFTLGLDSEFVMLETVLTTLKDELAFCRKHKVLVTAIVCFISFLFGIPFCTEGGFHLVDFYDTYSVDIGLLFVSLITALVVSFIYGLQRFCDDVEFMLGFRPAWWYWQICWCFLNPVVLFIILISGVINMGNSGYDLKEYQDHIKPAKWFLAWSPIAMTPIVAIAVIIYYWKKGDIKMAFRIPPYWGPADPLVNMKYQEWLQTKNKIRYENPNCFERLKRKFIKPKPPDDDEDLE